MYAQIIDGVIVKTQGQLPRSTDRVSNFYLLSEEERNAHGWYTVVETPEPAHDSILERVSGTNVVLVNGVPTTTHNVDIKTVEELKDELLSRAKNVAERVIQAEYSTQEQIAALANLTTAGHRTAVVNKIQTAYGAFMTFRTQLNAATTPAAVKTLWESYPALHGGN